eukprot:CAMPEP_0119005206 /NCGR_PEP_ID=MMETSP1176-20130426/1583_1 /TAXON_ID=265551 /ORGANISM="Synedropsis recta cf, Strain CCMP1620" /LENGTH=371 /DNA_ID=CAMNT_0006956983 /DNA_START=113 /DNA_END=1228 /DNA_ORIENTATION=-
MSNKRRVLCMSFLLVGITKAGIVGGERAAFHARGGGISSSNTNFFGSFEDEIRQEREKFELETMESLMEDLQQSELIIDNDDEEQVKVKSNQQEEQPRLNEIRAREQQQGGAEQNLVDSSRARNHQSRHDEMKQARQSAVKSRRAVKQETLAEQSPVGTAASVRNHRHAPLQKKQKYTASKRAVAQKIRKNNAVLHPFDEFENLVGFEAASGSVEADEKKLIDERQMLMQPVTFLSEDDDMEEDDMDDPSVASLQQITDAMKKSKRAKQLMHNKAKRSKKPVKVSVAAVSGGVKSVAKKPRKSAGKRKALAKQENDLMEARRLLQTELVSAQTEISRSEFRRASITGVILLILCAITALALRVVESSLGVP